MNIVTYSEKISDNVCDYKQKTPFQYNTILTRPSGYETDVSPKTKNPTNVGLLFFA